MKPFALSVSAVSLLVLAGCGVSGTTYGTGSSHEMDTMKSIGNMLSIKPQERPNIEYTERPDLVMPAEKMALPSPMTGEEVAREDWPETPEQRILAARAAAPEADWRSGDLPVEYLQSEKDGIANSADVYRTARSNTRSADGGLMEEIKQDAKTGGVSEEVRKRREQLAYSTSVQRKFLTEPPTEYRTPSENAEAGDLGVTKEVLTAAQKKARRDANAIENGVILPGQ